MSYSPAYSHRNGDFYSHQDNDNQLKGPQHTGMQQMKDGTASRGSPPYSPPPSINSPFYSPPSSPYSLSSLSAYYNYLHGELTNGLYQEAGSSNSTSVFLEDGLPPNDGDSQRRTFTQAPNMTTAQGSGALGFDRPPEEAPADQKDIETLGEKSSEEEMMYKPPMLPQGWKPKQLETGDNASQTFMSYDSKKIMKWPASLKRYIARSFEDIDPEEFDPIYRELHAVIVEAVNDGLHSCIHWDEMPLPSAFRHNQRVEELRQIKEEIVRLEEQKRCEEEADARRWREARAARERKWERETLKIESDSHGREREPQAVAKTAGPNGSNSLGHEAKYQPDQHYRVGDLVPQSPLYKLNIDKGINGNPQPGPSPRQYSLSGKPSCAGGSAPQGQGTSVQNSRPNTSDERRNTEAHTGVSGSQENRRDLCPIDITLPPPDASIISLPDNYRPRRQADSWRPPRDGRWQDLNWSSSHRPSYPSPYPPQPHNFHEPSRNCKSFSLAWSPPIAMHPPYNPSNPHISNQGSRAPPTQVGWQQYGPSGQHTSSSKRSLGSSARNTQQTSTYAQLATCGDNARRTKEYLDDFRAAPVNNRLHGYISAERPLRENNYSPRGHHEGGERGIRGYGMAQGRSRATGSTGYNAFHSQRDNADREYTSEQSDDGPRGNFGGGNRSSSQAASPQHPTPPFQPAAYQEPRGWYYSKHRSYSDRRDGCRNQRGGYGNHSGAGYN